MRQNQIDDQHKIEVEIQDIGDEGEGIGRVEGMAIFVPGALPGDKVLCQLVEQKKNYAKAKLLKIITASKKRVTPPCSIFERCGGCQIQNFDYAAQLELKQNNVENTLMRLGKFDNLKINPILGMETPYRYRNKGFYQVQGTSQSPLIGFYAGHSHTVVDAIDCLIQPTANREINQVIKAYMKSFGVEPYNPRTGKGIIKSVMIRHSETTGEIMVVLTTATSKLNMWKALTKNLIEAVPNIVSVMQSIHPGSNMKGLGDENRCLYGKNTILDQIGNLKFEIAAPSFYQVNSKQTERLYSKALELAALTGSENVFELYSGTGTISLFLASKAKHVYGVEIVPEAIENAKENAIKNGIQNVTFVLGSAEVETQKLYEAGEKADVVVVDPPRAGCDVKVIETILKMAPQKIVYISCKPSTLARDMMRLCETGQYKPIEIQPVDVFCHTAHVETVVLLEKIL